MLGLRKFKSFIFFYFLVLSAVVNGNGPDRELLNKLRLEYEGVNEIKEVFRRSQSVLLAQMSSLKGVINRLLPDQQINFYSELDSWLQDYEELNKDINKFTHDCLEKEGKLKKIIDETSDWEDFQLDEDINLTLLKRRVELSLILDKVKFFAHNDKTLNETFEYLKHSLNTLFTNEEMLFELPTVVRNQISSVRSRLKQLEKSAREEQVSDSDLSLSGSDLSLSESDLSSSDSYHSDVESVKENIEEFLLEIATVSGKAEELEEWSNNAYHSLKAAKLKKIIKKMQDAIFQVETKYKSLSSKYRNEFDSFISDIEEEFNQLAKERENFIKGMEHLDRLLDEAQQEDDQRIERKDIFKNWDKIENTTMEDFLLTQFNLEDLKLCLPQRFGLISDQANEKKLKGDQQIIIEDECSICLSEYESPERKITLDCCKKEICSDCLKNNIETNLKSNKFKTECPLGVGENRHTLNLNLTSDTVKVLKIDPILFFLIVRFEKLNYFQTHKKNFLECPNKDCPNYFHLKDRQLQEESCQLCGTEVCKKCKMKKHDSPCGEKMEKVRQADEEMRRLGYMDCPFCLCWNEKDKSCSHVTCSQCNNVFDFVTGGPWTAKSTSRIRANYGSSYYKSDIASKEVLKNVKKELTLIHDRGTVPWSGKYERKGDGTESFKDELADYLSDED